ncbi:ABC transporter permease [Kitasatospora sp. NPDC059408]|uniref:ABC transporter permease n=1 Tax=Kitasatospora sp. NPDC059408 TaxID=3346823 RepID=UPI0036B1389C
MTRRTARPLGPAAWAVLPLLALIALAALWPGLLEHQAPDAVNPVDALQGPGGAHWFGTDQLGRDIYSRVVAGARPSLLTGLGVTALALAGGSALALLGLVGGRVVDGIVMRITDVLFAFPGILLALLVVTVLGRGTAHATLAIGCAFVPGFTRLVRSQALVVREADYVRAAVVCGQRHLAVHLRHVLPNALPPLLVLATVNIGTAILSGASLSFLGLGPQPSDPEWGAMLAQSKDFLGTTWPLAVFPGAALTLTVLAVNVVGRDLQRRFEGRLPGGSR